MATEPIATPSALPPHQILYQMAIGHYLSRALHLAAKLGIPDLLAHGPRASGELAAATATHPASLQRVLRLLASVGVFEEQEDHRFALTPVSEYLRADVPQSFRALVMLFAGNRTQDAWKELEYCVRMGEPAFRKRGDDDWLAGVASDPEEAAIFDAAMADFTRLVAVAVAAAYDFSSLHTVVDVGGGTGALLIGILQANPHLRGIVFDRPDAAQGAQQHISETGLGDRCQAVAGDFFREVPRGGEAYILKHVIHDWNDERAATILGNCHRAMGGDGRLLVIEGVYPPRIQQSQQSYGAAANDVNMLVATGGRQRSEAEFRSLYQAAGFRLGRIVRTLAPVSVIEGLPG